VNGNQQHRKCHRFQKRHRQQLLGVHGLASLAGASSHVFILKKLHHLFNAQLRRQVHQNMHVIGRPRQVQGLIGLKAYVKAEN